MNFFEKIMQIVKNLEAGLNAINKCRSYRVTRAFRIVWTEVKSLSPKRICKLIKKILSRLTGNRDAMREYIRQDKIVDLIDQAGILRSSLQQKIENYNTIERVVISDVHAKSIHTAENTDEYRWLNFDYQNRSLNRRKKTGNRVAYFTNLLLDWEDKRPRFGGGERYCLTLSRLLRKNGFEVQIYQTAPTEFSGDYFGFPVQTITYGNYYSEFNIDAAEKFYQISLDYDYVIYNLPELSAMRMRPDAIMICHGIWFDHSNYGGNIKFRENKWFEHLHRAFENPESIVSVDTNSINVIRSLWPQLATKMNFIPNFVDHNMFYPPHEPRSNEKLTILFPRRSQINRGSRLVEGILKAVPHDVDFYWVGEGDSADTQLLLDLVKKDSRLHYNAATFDEMPDWYRRADIAVIPTIACEGTSLSCIEAMASGCATISTNVGGLTDLVYDEFNGLLVNPTVDDIAQAIIRLIEDKELRDRLQEQGYQYSFNFSIEKWEERWNKVLTKHGWFAAQTRRDYCIITKNAIHGGVESLIALEAQKLNADIIVAGGLNDPEQTCPFTYDYINNYIELKNRISSYKCILYHWPFDWAVQAIRDSGVPSVEFVHRTDTAQCDKTVPTVIVSHSQYVCDYISDTYSRSCNLVPNVVDTDFYMPFTGEKENIIGAVTSYYDTKGIDILIRAWRLVQDDLADYDLVIYGAGDKRHDYELLANDIGCRVRLNGPLSNSKIAYDQLKMVLSASRIEGLPIALLEAISCGVPVLASDIDGHKIINKLAENKGFSRPIHLFKTEDVDDLARRLKDLVPNLQKDVAQITELRKIAVEVFSPVHHIEGLCRAFEQAEEQFLKHQTLVASVEEEINIPAQLFHVDQGSLSPIVFPCTITNSKYCVINISTKENFNFLTVECDVSVDAVCNITNQVDSHNQLNRSEIVHTEGYLLNNQEGHIQFCYDYDHRKDKLLSFTLRCNPLESFLLKNVSIKFYTKQDS